jgi:hypothetical protein
MSDPSPSFDYFVVRLNRSDPTANRITGLVERLGSGEKQPFETAEHLAHLISTWTAPGGAQDGDRREDLPTLRHFSTGAD